MQIQRFTKRGKSYIWTLCPQIMALTFLTVAALRFSSGCPVNVLTLGLFLKLLLPWSEWQGMTFLRLWVGSFIQWQARVGSEGEDGFSFFSFWFLCHLWQHQVVLVVKNLLVNAWNMRHVGLIPGSRRTPGGGHGNPLQYSCLENPMDRGRRRAIVHGVTKSQTQLKQLSTDAHVAACLP